MTSFKMTSNDTASFKLNLLRISWLDWFLSLLLWLLALAFVAGLVHIVSVFALPELAQKDAYSRLSVLTQPGQLSLLPALLPGQEYAPFEDPALVQAVCLYDLERGPLELSADIIGDGLLTFSFRSRTGRVFYSMTDKAASHGKIDVLVLTPKQLEAVEADDDDEELPQELRLTAPEKKGFVLVNALVGFPSERANIETSVKSMSCEIVDEAEK
jgi:uncharacterized membrane protein